MATIKKKPLQIRVGKPTQKNPHPQFREATIARNGEDLYITESEKTHQSIMKNIKSQYKVWRQIVMEIEANPERKLEDFIDDLSKTGKLHKKA